MKYLRFTCRQLVINPQEQCLLNMTVTAKYLLFKIRGTYMGIELSYTVHLKVLSSEMDPKLGSFDRSLLKRDAWTVSGNLASNCQLRCKAHIALTAPLVLHHLANAC